MKRLTNFKLFFVLLVLLPSCKHHSQPEKTQLPNILVLFADDMGYGDVGCYNPGSKIHTPNINSLAEAGMRFTDAHAPGTFCIPSRYGLLTGKYPFMNARSYKKGLIGPGELTIASLLKKSGYHTACIGKWHQGIVDEKNPRPGVKLAGGPTEHGFDYFFGMPASLDIPPYYYIENGYCTSSLSDTIDASHTPGISPVQGAFWRKGGIASGFKHENVLEELANKTEQYLNTFFSKSKDPLFLYCALPSPHTPWLPAERFKGSSPIGSYGDYVVQVDDIVGRIIKKLDELGQAGNTLVVFTSDNGPVWFPEDIARYGHSSTGPLKGMKSNVWEGGHRMPFVVCWPGKIKPNSVNGHLACFTDLLATFAEITNQKLPENPGYDSFSLLQQMTGHKSSLPERESLIIKGTVKNSFTVRKGDWKLINCKGGGGFLDPGYPDTDTIPRQLYNLKTDIGETQNLYYVNQSKAKELSDILNGVISK